jgi:hypothetical protein
VQALLAPTEADALDSPIFSALGKDAGLDQVVPYIVALISSEVRASADDLAKLNRLLHAAALLIQNPFNNLGAYLSQLIPALMTCLLCGRLGTPRASLQDAMIRQ